MNEYGEMDQAADWPLGVPMNKSMIALISAVFAVLLPVIGTAQADERRLFQPEDIHALKKVGDSAVSPDGEWVAYSVGDINPEKDTVSSDLFMVNWDGSERIQLTHTADAAESHPRFSPDGKYIAFISARSDGSTDDDDDAKAKSQVWILNRAGGEAQRVTEMPGGVSGFEWSPNSGRMVLVSTDPDDDPEESESGEKPEKTHDTPDPIVIDRYRFKQDRVGYLGDQYQRLYLFDVETWEVSLLTEGDFDNSEPNWSPAGDVIAFTSKRGGDPDRHENSDIFLIDASANSEARQLTTWEGADSTPVFSPDGKYIAYIQGGPEKYTFYDPSQLAVIPLSGGASTFPAGDLDRTMSSPSWSEDGEMIHFQYPDDRVRSVARVAADGGAVEIIFPAPKRPGVVWSYEVGPKGIVTLTSFPQSPPEIYRADDGLALSAHNRELVDAIQWASVEGFDAVSEDGTAVGSMLLKPPGFNDGDQYPTIVHVHGGPFSQDGYEFDYQSQILAAQGYLVVNPNYRGSNGRGRDFARAIYAEWGTLEIKDIHAVVDELVEQGLADPERLGIGGWSYGGINTNFAIATDTRFSAAVSGSSISNYMTGYGTDQYIWQYETEIGLPWESTERYDNMSYPFFHADRIETPTLFMCGEKDFNVPVINSEQMYQALRSLNIPTQLVVYPGQYHGLSTPSYKQDHLERMIGWYGKYLGMDSE